MGESLGVSVSFGKYENDAALSWEKWSTFSPNNKYLEEVGKCSTPGSVAQKKAFFEAHYKKIAAMKLAEAELLPDDSTPDDCTQEPPIDGSGTQFQQDESMPPITLDSSNHAAAADKLEAAALVNVESMKLVKQHFHVDLETPQQTPQNFPPEINQKEVEKNSIEMKKKSASVVIPKSPETPAGRLPKSKPKPTSAPSLNKTSAQPSSLKKPNTLSSSKNKSHSVSESRRLFTGTQSSSLKKASAPSLSSKNMSYSVSESRRLSMGTPSSSLKKKTPVSLHLSMSMNSVYSDTASSVTSSRRRSLFMEQMGDKDIVKRAFKTFQNRVNQLPSSDTGPKQMPTKRSEQKTSTLMPYQNENERSRKAAAEKINPARGHLGPIWKSVSSGLVKGVGANERRLKAGPTSVPSKSNERSERRKEFFKNLEEKSNARVAERSQLSLKPKDAEMKKVRQKAKAQGVLKSS